MLYTVAEMAQKLRVNPATVYALCNAKKLAHTRVGAGRGAIRISDEAINNYLQTNTAGPALRSPAAAQTILEE